MKEIKTVTSLTGRVWMDRNLGAERIAQTIDDALSFGDLYQWGRPSDGHEKRDSNIVRETTKNKLPNNPNFMIGNSPYYNWCEFDRRHLWTVWLTVNPENNPCPEGFRLPTKQEWVDEMATWESQDANGAFNSVLKLPSAGVRNWDGDIIVVGEFASYWTCTPTERKKDMASYYFEATQHGAKTYGTSRSFGNSVRCIKI